MSRWLQLERWWALECASAIVAMHLEPTHSQDAFLAIVIRGDLQETWQSWSKKSLASAHNLYAWCARSCLCWGRGRAGSHPLKQEKLAKVHHLYAWCAHSCLCWGRGWAWQHPLVTMHLVSKVFALHWVVVQDVLNDCWLVMENCKTNNIYGSLGTP